jgi:hypothetical protein
MKLGTISLGKAATRPYSVLISKNYLARDAQAREQAISQRDRQVLRLEKSKPLLEQIKTQI